jgi:hypothetical protein
MTATQSNMLPTVYQLAHLATTITRAGSETAEQNVARALEIWRAAQTARTAAKQEAEFRAGLLVLCLDEYNERFSAFVGDPKQLERIAMDTKFPRERVLKWLFQRRDETSATRQKKLEQLVRYAREKRFPTAPQLWIESQSTEIAAHFVYVFSALACAHGKERKARGGESSVKVFFENLCPDL